MALRSYDGLNDYIHRSEWQWTFNRKIITAVDQSHHSLLLI